LEGEENEMRQKSRQKPAKESPLGVKLLRSAQQARDWVNGKPGRVRVTYVPVPQVDVRKLRTKMGLSQTQFAARFGFSLDSIQNWEQGHRQPEGPARTLLAVIAKNPKAVREALGSL
jgi:putative transcriptional regulator